LPTGQAPLLSGYITLYVSVILSSSAVHDSSYYFFSQILIKAFHLSRHGAIDTEECDGGSTFS